MPFSVADFLKLPETSLAVVHSAQGRLEARPVEGISVIEAPVQDFVQKNEIVLTTAMGCSDEANFLDFIAEIQESGAAALVVATGYYLHDISANVVAYAEAAGFPLIEIPWRIRFADITKSLLKNIFYSPGGLAPKTGPSSRKGNNNPVPKVKSADAIRRLLAYNFGRDFGQNFSGQAVWITVESVIGGLLEYDRLHNLDLTGTCRVYLQYNSNVSQAASALHLHRQSLLYRLKKIEMLTALSLGDADDLFLLNLCLRLWQYRQESL